jgi:hypothetical protein
MTLHVEQYFFFASRIVNRYITPLLDLADYVGANNTLAR